MRQLILMNSICKGHSKATLIVEPLSYYTLALPDDLTLWTVPAQGIRRWNEEALVYDVGYGGTALRHYAFYHCWYAINCTLDRSGQFVTEKEPIDWCFNIDIGTPLFTRNNAAYDVDLCLDVLVGPDGREYVVKDEDEFEHAVKQGWVTAQEQEGARSGLKELLNIIQSGALLDFLHTTCPFHSMEDVLAQPPARKVPLEQVPLLHRETRYQHFGKHLPQEQAGVEGSRTI